MHPMPQPPSGRQPSGPSKTLVGGLQWQQSADRPPAIEAGPTVVPGMPVILTNDSSKPPGAGSDDAAANQRSWPERFDSWVRQSPPFTISVSLHVVAILIFALLIVRREESQMIRLDLSIASEEIGRASCRERV